MNIASSSFKGNNSSVDITIADMAHLLERNPNERSKYICPVCGGHNLSINLKTGKYDCFDDQTPEHRSAIFTTLLKQYRPIEGWTDLQRAEHQSTKTKAKVQKKKAAIEKGKFADEDPMKGLATSLSVEMKINVLAEQFDPPRVTEAKLINELEGWCIESKIPHFNAVRLLKEAIAARTAIPEIDEDDSEDYKRAIGRADARIDFDKLLHPKLSRLIQAAAASLPVQAEGLYLHYRSATASIVGTSAKLALSDSWVAGLNCCTAVLSAAGSRKSASLSKITRPLITLQKEAEERYKQDLKEYAIAYRIWQKEVKEDATLAEPEKPAMQHYLILDATIESLAPILKESPRHSILSVQDELSGFLGQMGAYGAGEKAQKDMANYLSLMVGGMLKTNRANVERNIFVEETAFSLTGSTQPETFFRMVSEAKDKNNGFWDRFRFASCKFIKSRHRGKSFDSDPHFLQIFRNLQAIPDRLYQLSPEAREAFDEFVDWIEDHESKVSPTYFSILNKMQGKLAVEILSLHLEDAAMEGNMYPDAQVPKSVVDRAIVAIQYDIIQTKNIYERLIDQTLDGKILDAIEYCKRGDGTITKKQMIHRRIVKNAAEGDELMNEMVAKCLGVDERPTARLRVFRYVEGGVVGEGDLFVSELANKPVTPDPTPQFEPREIEEIEAAEPETEIEVTWEEQSQPVDAPPTEEPVIEGFQVGDRVEIVFPEHFDKATRKESARNNEAPYGQHGTIEQIAWVRCPMRKNAWDARIKVTFDDPSIEDLGSGFYPEWVKVLTNIAP